MFQRGLNDDNFARFQQDFRFLFDRIRAECGELDLRIRNNYFNLYHRGNSLAKVVFGRSGYKVEIHKEFARGLFDPVRFDQPMVRGSYLAFSLHSTQLHPFFSKSHLDALSRKIKARNFSEEIAFEQMLITDNAERDDLLLIDRQIEGGKIKGKMDLLALRQTAPNSTQFQFVVIELKLGANPELCVKVVGQLKDYVRTLEDDFDQFRKCYEKVYAQLKAVGLVTKPTFPSVTIVRPVLGQVIVGGYPGLANKAILQLMTRWPHLPLQQMRLPISVEPQEWLRFAEGCLP